MNSRFIALLKRLLLTVLWVVLIPISLAGAWSFASGWPDSWRTADWSSSRLAPNPAIDKHAIIHVYAARAGRWKGIFSVHTWIAFKPKNAERFTRFDVVGWGPPIRKNGYPEDGRWYGNTPEIILEIKGEQAEQLIPKIQTAVSRYPYNQHGSYRVWPGPNSNTFVAWIGRELPELGLEMPPHAVGKDYIGDGIALAVTPSGSGWQLSFWGVLGMAVAWQEGLEVHLLGATIGLDFNDLGIKLPGIGALSLTSQ